MCLSVIAEPHRRGLGRLSMLSHEKKKVAVRLCDLKPDNMRSGFQRPARNPSLIFLLALSIRFTL